MAMRVAFPLLLSYRFTMAVSVARTLSMAFPRQTGYLSVPAANPHRLTRHLVRFCIRMASAPSNALASPTRAENKGPAGPEQPPSSSQHEHIRLFSDAAVEVRWADPTSGPSSAKMRLFVVHTADLSQAFVQLQVRNVELRNEPNKKTFYLNLPVERIARLALADAVHRESFGAQVYPLNVTLNAPLDLVGPPTPGCAAGWPEAKSKGKRLLSLASALDFTIYISTAWSPREKVSSFCQAVSSRQAGPRSIAALYETKRLYSGSGGHLYVSAASPSDEVTEHPSPRALSEVSTVSAATPPGYSGHGPPVYVESEVGNDAHLRQGKRRRSEDLDLSVPKRPTLSGGEVSTPKADAPPLASSSHFELEIVVRTLVLQNQQLCQQIERLTGQVNGLEQSQADLQQQLATAKQSQVDLRQQLATAEQSQVDLQQQLATAEQRYDERHDSLKEQVEVVEGDQYNMEKQVESLEHRTWALEEDYEEVDRRLPDIAMAAEDAVREYTEDALRAFVSDIVEDYVDEERPLSVQELVDTAVQDRIAAIADRIFDTLRAAVVPSSLG
jgi:hypothetical protein